MCQWNSFIECVIRDRGLGPEDLQDITKFRKKKPAISAFGKPPSCAIAGRTRTD